MLTKIKNFVKKAFKKVKEVIMNTVEAIKNIAEKIIDKPEVKSFIEFAAPKAIVSGGVSFTLALAVCYIYYHFNKDEIYESARAHEKFRRDTDMKYSIDIL